MGGHGFRPGQRVVCDHVNATASSGSRCGVVGTVHQVHRHTPTVDVDNGKRRPVHPTGGDRLRHLDGPDPQEAATGMLCDAIDHAARALARVDDELAHLAGVVARAADTVTTGLKPESGQPTPTLNPLGELRGGGLRFDAAIAVRAERINHLKVLVGLWSRCQSAGGSTR